jgi:bifunctional non-homologous end joining protein LigD
MTKGDLINYYETVAPFILPYLKNRPLSLKRNPNGIKDNGFYHKDAGDIAPDWMKTADIHAASTGKTVHYLVCNNVKSLLFIANLGCIEMNPWNSVTAKLDNPDYLVLDIDPSDKNTFDQVIEVALTIKDVLGKAGITGYCKTSGASGMHVYIPCGRKYDYDTVRDFAKILATLVQEQLPSITTLERSLSKRKKNQVYIDYLQNSRGQTLASAYSARPKPGATVSAPLDWKEVKKGLEPSQFTMKNIVKRVEKKGDLFAPVLEKGINIPAAIKKIEKF